MATNVNKTGGADTNPDPITGAPGSHPGGTAIGSASGAATGAALGSLGGPVGAIIGGIAGAITGAGIGHGIGEWVDPTESDAYWRENYKTTEFDRDVASYDEVEPAYRYGYSSYGSEGNRGKSFDDVRENLRSDWSKQSSNSKFDWDSAEPAVRDAYSRAYERDRTETNSSGR